MLRSSCVLLRRGQPFKRKFETHGGFYGAYSRERKPGKRRLFAGQSKTHPLLTYWKNWKPRGQQITKGAYIYSRQSRMPPKESTYAVLEWEDEEDTPNLLHPNSLDLQGYGKGEAGDYYTGHHIVNGRLREEIETRPVGVSYVSAKEMGKVHYPPVPAVDARVLSNAEFQAPDVQERVRKYLQKHQLFSIFPKVTCALNLNVSYAEDDAPRKYWQSVFRGNVIEHAKTHRTPRVMLPADGVEADALYTLVMMTPDYPFRAEPEDGFVLHWMVANVKPEDGRVDVAAKGDEVLPYLMPLPSEDAGLLRYCFVLYKQAGRVDVAKATEEQARLRNRRGLFLHDPQRPGNDLHPVLAKVEAQIDDVPTALSFFHTAFDYEVMEWYRAQGIPEPMYTPSDIQANTVGFMYRDKADMFTAETPFGRTETAKTAPAWQRTRVEYF